jgi:hypothetical protein
MNRKAVVAFVCSLAMVGVAQAQESARMVVQTVPPADVSHPTGQIQGDLWAFEGRAGDVIDVRIDTRDDNNNTTSNLDPILFLRRPDGSLLFGGDDNVACSREPVCGYACPLLIGFPLDQSGRWEIVVRDYGGSGCLSGSYTLGVEGPLRVTRSLKLAVDDGVVQAFETAIPFQQKVGQ